MCKVSAGKPVSRTNTDECACDLLLVRDEIRILEEHRNTIQEQIEAVDKKIAALKTVKDP